MVESLPLKQRTPAGHRGETAGAHRGAVRNRATAGGDMPLELPATRRRAAVRAAGERPLLFLDFEASSLSPQSWPIEIGVAWIEAGRVETGSMLIAPRPDWPLSDWSEPAALVHGIPLAEVLEGVPAEAAAAATDVIAACDVVSDNPIWDQRWLDRLRAGRPRVRLLGLRPEMLRRLSPPAADDLCLRLLQNRSRHRAAPDAERLARAWLAAARRHGLAT
jgi:hypothetical protein